MPKPRPPAAAASSPPANATDAASPSAVAPLSYLLPAVEILGTNGGHDNILRGDASFTDRIARQQAVTVKVIGNRRDARFVNPATQEQTQVTVGIFYTLLGQDRFGTVDWR